MSADQIVLLVVGLIVISAVAMTVAYATSIAARGRPSRPRADGGGEGLRQRAEEPGAFAATTIRSSTTFFTPASTRQVARVVALLFLAAVAVVVALTRAWPESEPAIYTVLAAGLLLVVVFMDMIPPSAFGRYRRPLEGIGAIVYLGLLMALTGGAASPFLVGFYLVAAGTALSSEGRAPLAVAVVGAVTIAAVGLVDAIDGPLDPEALAWIGINAVSLILLADIATAAARAQRHARDEALRASRFDALTGLYNRAFFFTTMEQELRRSDRMGRGFTMLMLDLDDLKPVNDTYGHQWGDRLLKAIAETIRQTIRFTDAAARYGGDEFVVLLPETDAMGGYVVGEKLRRDIYALTLNAADRNVRSSVSIGLVAYPDDGSSIEQLVAAADVAMYEAKRRGKNRIVGYQTRTERVATDIDAATHDLVQLTPTSDVRTGGDPVPWGGSGREGQDRAGEHERDVPLPPSSRPPGRSTIPVRPEGGAGTPWLTEPSAPRRTESRGSASRGSEPRGSEPRSGDRGPEQRSSERRPSDLPPEPPTRLGTAVGAPVPPWLTRTTGEAADGTGAELPGNGSARVAPPPADRPTSRQHDGARGSSRIDEILEGDDDRPWIALPIEPDEEGDRPRR